MKFKAVIPTAGEGRRLRPHTHAVPKVLLEVAGKPIIGHIMDRLLPAGPEEVCVVVGARGDQIASYLTGAYDYSFRFVEQPEPRGLGDAVYCARECFQGEPVLVLLGDTIVDVDLSGFVGQGSVVGVKEVDDPRRFGIAELDGERVTRVVEKPAKPSSKLALVGVYFFQDSKLLFDALSGLIRQDLRTGGELQLTDAIQSMVERGADIRARRIEHWLDCGTQQSLLDTNRYLLEKDGCFEPRERAVIVPPVFIHDSARIENSVVGPNVSVGPDAEIHRSVIRNSIINGKVRLEHVILEGSILGEGSMVRDIPRKLNLGGFSQWEAGGETDA